MPVKRQIRQGERFNPAIHIDRRINSPERRRDNEASGFSSDSPTGKTFAFFKGFKDRKGADFDTGPDKRFGPRDRRGKRG